MTFMPMISVCERLTKTVLYILLSHVSLFSLWQTFFEKSKLVNTGLFFPLKNGAHD